MLTKREIEVVRLIKDGLTQIEVSKKLKISQPAISGLYNNALRKIQDSKQTLQIAKELGVEHER